MGVRSRATAVVSGTLLDLAKIDVDQVAVLGGRHSGARQHSKGAGGTLPFRQNKQNGMGLSMENLTTAQRAKLKALMEELEKLPTPEVIAESGRLRVPRPLDDAGKKRMRLAIGGGIAAQKLLAYIYALDDVDGHRGLIGRRIAELLQEGDRLRKMESLDAAEPLVSASYLAGRQEVDYHFFAVCVGRIERLLPIAAKAAGHRVLREDQELLRTFRPLRDYYEHLEDRLPGGKNDAETMSETNNEDEWRLTMGHRLDDLERIVLGKVAVDVTPRGVAAVRAVLRRNWDQLQPSALGLVRTHLVADPSAIPDPKEVEHRLLVSTSGRS